MKSIGAIGVAFVAVGALACGSPGTAAETGQSNQGGAPTKFAGVHAIDWRNTTYELTLLEGEGPTSFLVQDGRWAADTAESVQIDDVVFGDLTGDGLDEVAIASTFRAAGFTEIDRVDVFGSTVGDDVPRWLGLVRGGKPGDGNVAGVQIRDGVLRVLRAGVDEGDWEAWAWDGAYFERDGQ